MNFIELKNRRQIDLSASRPGGVLWLRLTKFDNLRRLDSLYE